MVIHENYGLLAVNGGDAGAGIRLLVDLSDPATPQVIHEDDPEHTLQIASKDDVVFILKGFVRTTTQLAQFTQGELQPLPQSHPFRRAFESQAAAQMHQDSAGQLIIEPQGVLNFINDFIQLGNLLVTSWHHLDCLGDDSEETQCPAAGIMLWDLSDPKEPLIIDSYPIAEMVSLFDLNEEGILLQYGRTSRTTTEVDLRPFLKTSHLSIVPPTRGELNPLEGESVLALAKQDSYGYLLTDQPALHIIDLTALPHLTILHTQPLDFEPSRLEIANALITLTSGKRLDIYQQSPTSLELTSRYSVEQETWFSSALTTNGVILGQEDQLTIIPHSDLTTFPDITREIELKINGRFLSTLATYGDYSYWYVDLTEGGHALMTIDLSVPEQPIIADIITIDSIEELAPYSVWLQQGIIQDQYLFVDCDLSLICVFDITSNQGKHPQFVGASRECDVDLQTDQSRLQPPLALDPTVISLPRPTTATDYLTDLQLPYYLCRSFNTYHQAPYFDSIVHNNYWLRAEGIVGLIVSQTVPQ